MQRPGPNGNDLVPLVSGTGVTPTGYSNVQGASKSGYTLSSGTTYYYYLGQSPKESPYQSVHVKWDNAAILTISVEDTDFDDVTAYDATAGNWLHEDPTTAYVAASGGTPTNATVAVAGGTAGGCLFHLGQNGALRTRLKVVVGGTGGVVRVAMNAKD